MEKLHVDLVKRFKLVAPSIVTHASRLKANLTSDVGNMFDDGKGTQFDHIVILI